MKDEDAQSTGGYSLNAILAASDKFSSAPQLKNMTK